MKILAIKHLNVKQKDGQIKPSILVTTAQADIWVTPGQWKAAGAGASLDSYTGGNINAVYFVKGELLFDNETVCTDDNKILKSVFVSANPTVLAYATAIEAKSQMEDAETLAVLYARRRAAERIKAEEQAAKEALKNAEAGKALA